ncbi:MAG: hypothetical protein F6K65_14885 [Moorea sp. SIO3C2]|nr:hypothetical protein [Moorena sp. SIO3C2]
MGIFVEWASLWNGHLCGMGIFVEWASCPFHFSGGHVGAMGIFVEWVSLWNGHLARYIFPAGMLVPWASGRGTGILPVPISAQDAHSTPIHYLTDATPANPLQMVLLEVPKANG